jgi:hypothetical protein
MTSFRPGISGISLLLALLAAVPAHGQMVKGTFRFGKVRFEPVDAMAYQGTISGDKPPVLIVALTSYKIERPLVLAAINPLDSLIAQTGEHGSVVLVLPESPDRCSVRGFLAESGQSIDLGSSSAKMSVSTATRIAGECATQKPGKFFDDEYEFRLSYDVPITAIAKPATLPVGGGEPGAQYLGLVKAIQAADWDVVHLHIREEELPESKNKPSDRNYFESLSLNYPKSATVTGGLLKGDRARLDIRGKNHDGGNFKGFVSMKKVGDNWRIVDQVLFHAE